METTIKLLDHGYIKLVEAWGSEAGIIEAARMSTNKGFLGWEARSCDCWGPQFPVINEGDVNGPNPDCINCNGKGTLRGDKHLLRYLYENKHATPFEMAGLIIEVQAPIFVFREWHRHRTQSYNELSSRYTPLPDLNYIPTVERLMMNSKTNKQAQSTGKELTEIDAKTYLLYLKDEYQQAQHLYQVALEMGIPKELARIHLPVGRYSRMRASANLRNWLAFLTLRMDEKAQWEIQQYANAMSIFINTVFPRTYELFASEQEARFL